MRRNASGGLNFGQIWMALGVAIFLLVVVSLVRNLFDLLNMGERLVAAEKEVLSLRQEHEELQAQADMVRAGELEEEVIREELGLVKPGEVVVVIPEDLLIAETDITIDPGLDVEFKPIWKQWVDLVIEGK